LERRRAERAALAPGRQINGFRRRGGVMGEHVSTATIPRDPGATQTRETNDALRSRTRRFVGGAAIAGTIGSVLIALAAPRLVDGGAVSWWYTISFPFGPDGNRAGLYLGMALLCGSWLILGYATRLPGVATRNEVWAITLAWIVPLLIAPSVFSRDMYSYLAQGAILHVGLDPYHHGPIVLRQFGETHLVDTVSSFWWRTPAPYGPLFLGVVSLVFAATASHLVAGVVVVRLLAVVGVGLIGGFLPRIAHVLGTDPLRAVWIGAMSPLVMLQLVLAGHNDALMAGLMVAGVALFLERRPRLGILFCAIASVVKLPALVAVVFLAVVWIRSKESSLQRLRALGESVAIVVGVVGGVSAATGVGLGWLSSSVLTVPGKVHLAITPVTELGWTIAPVLRALGAHVGNRAVASGFGVAADVGLVVIGALLLYRADTSNLVSYLGTLFVLAALFGPAAWPWYFIWGLALLATVVRTRGAVLVAVLAVIAVFLVKPDGILALPVGSSPVILAIYVILGAVALWWIRTTRSGAEPGRRLGDVDAASVRC
jgi:hypothetical protein